MNLGMTLVSQIKAFWLTATVKTWITSSTCRQNKLKGLVQWCSTFCQVDQIGSARSLCRLEAAGIPNPDPRRAQQAPSGCMEGSRGHVLSASIQPCFNAGKRERSMTWPSKDGRGCGPALCSKGPVHISQFGPMGKKGAWPSPTREELTAWLDPANWPYGAWVWETCSRECGLVKGYCSHATKFPDL